VNCQPGVVLCYFRGLTSHTVTSATQYTQWNAFHTFFKKRQRSLGRPWLQKWQVCCCYFPTEPL